MEIRGKLLPLVTARAGRFDPGRITLGYNVDTKTRRRGSIAAQLKLSATVPRGCWRRSPRLSPRSHRSGFTVWCLSVRQRIREIGIRIALGADVTVHVGLGFALACPAIWYMTGLLA